MFSAVAGKQPMSRMHRSIFSVLLLSLLGCATVAPASAQGTTLVLLNLSDSWRYNDADCLDGIPWTAPGYDDSTVNWVSGPGGFTGGETRTEALPGVTTTSLPAPNSGTRAGRAMYFRSRFIVQPRQQTHCSSPTALMTTRRFISTAS